MSLLQHNNVRVLWAYFRHPHIHALHYCLIYFSSTVRDWKLSILMSIRYDIIWISFSFLMSTTFPIPYHCWCILYCFLYLSIQLAIYLFICISLTGLLYPQLCLCLSLSLFLYLFLYLSLISSSNQVISEFLDYYYSKYLTNSFIQSLQTCIKAIISPIFSSLILFFSFSFFPFPYYVSFLLRFQLILLLSIFPFFYSF